MNIPDEQVHAAFKKLPYPMRSFLAGPELGDLVEGMGTTYAIHIDALGVIAEALTEMLLGLINPTQFASKLEAAGISHDQINAISREVDEKIFRRIREQERAEGVDTTLTTPASLDLALQTPPPTRAQASSVPAAPLISVPAPLSMPLPASESVPVPAPIREPVSFPASEPLAPVAPEEPTMRTMAHDVEAMQTGHTPAPTPYTMPASTPVPMTTVATPNQPIPPTVNALARPVSAPIIPPPAIVPPSQIPVAPSIQKTPVPDIHEVTSTLQKYGIDPYREPPE